MMMWSGFREGAEKRPLVFCSAFFIVGTALGKLLWEINLLLIICCAVSVFLAALQVLIFRFFPLPRMLYVLLFFLLAGSLNFYRVVYIPQDDISRFAGSYLSVTGYVWEEPLVDGNRATFDLKVQEIKGRAGHYQPVGAQEKLEQAGSQAVTGRVRVSLYGSGEQFNYGDRIRIKGQLESPPGRRNPGGFDYQFYLLTQGVTAVLRADYHYVERLEGTGGNSIIGYSISLRNSLLQKIEQVLPPQERALLGGVLLGNREGISQAMQQNFQRAGTAHLLAVSGLHVGLLAAIFLTLLKYMRVKEQLSWVLTLTVIIIYVGVIGFKVSAVRAALLLFLGAGAFLLKREKDPLTALSAAALAVLLVKPLWLFTLSFQLSFIAALSIFIVMPFFEKHTVFLPGPLRKVLCVTLAAQLGVIPLTAYYFYEVSLISLIANVLVFPVVGAVVALGSLSAVCGFLFPGVERLMFSICGFLLTYLINTTNYLSQVPGAYVKLNPPGSLFLSGYYVFIFLLLPREEFWGKVKQMNFIKIREMFISGNKTVPLALSLTLLFIWLPVFHPGHPELTVVFLDVGQGDSAFIKTSCGRSILIDAGGSPAYLQTEDYGTDFVGERVVVPFLRHQGIKKLDMVVLSHPHEDHYGGLLAVLDNFSVDLFVTTRAESDFPLFIELMTMVQEKNIPLLYMQSGDMLSSPELTLEFFNPPENLFKGTPADLNNNSLVFRLTSGSGNVSFLFTGDAEQAAEEYMLRCENNFQSQVLKVGHHGGRSSTGKEFLEAVNPQVAVIQVGRNSFGHPSQQVLERLEEQDVIIYRNDHHGAVSVRVRGEQIQVVPFVNGFYAPIFQQSDG